MQQLVREFAEHAARAPGDIAVIDALGEHTLGEVMQAARDLAVLLEEMLGGSPTVLVQADNTWRTLATALAVGLRGGMVAVFSSHAVASEFALATDDIEPDAVVASDDALEHWAVSGNAFPDKRAVLDGWTLVSTGRPASDVGRWRGGVAVAMTSGSTGHPKCVVQSEESLRYAAGPPSRRSGSSRVTPSGRSSHCPRSRRTASGCTFPRCSAVRWCASSRGTLTRRSRRWRTTTCAGRCWSRPWLSTCRSGRREREGSPA